MWQYVDGLVFHSSLKECNAFIFKGWKVKGTALHLRSCESSYSLSVHCIRKYTLLELWGNTCYRGEYSLVCVTFSLQCSEVWPVECTVCVYRKRMTARECLQHTWLAQHDEKMSCVRLSTDKLKKFIIRRKWQVRDRSVWQVECCVVWR